MKIKKVMKVVRPFVLLLCIYLLATSDFVAKDMSGGTRIVYSIGVAAFTILALCAQDIIKKL